MGGVTVMNISEAKQIVLEKFKYICIAGFVCAIIAGGYKYCFTPSVGYEGNFIYTRLVQINDNKKLSNPYIEFNYSGILNTDGNYVAFIKIAENTYNFSKINSSWHRINQQEKIRWFRRMIRFNNFRNDTYEIIFNLPANNILDLPYMKKNISGLVDVFVSQGNQLIRKIKSDTDIKTVSESLLLPKEVVNNKKAIAFKYSVYGFIAGILLSMAVFIGIPFFKRIQE